MQISDLLVNVSSYIGHGASHASCQISLIAVILDYKGELSSQSRSVNGITKLLSMMIRWDNEAMHAGSEQKYNKQFHRHS